MANAKESHFEMTSAQQQVHVADDDVIFHWVKCILGGSKNIWYKFVQLNDTTSVPIVQAFMYYFLTHGLGYCNKDHTLALQYCNESADWIHSEATVQGNPHAQFILANMHAYGHLVPQNEVLAVEYWHRSAAMGCELAYAELGAAYNLGKGCELSKVLAMYWLCQADNIKASTYAGDGGFSPHSKTKIDLLGELFTETLRGDANSLANLKLASCKDVVRTVIPISNATHTEHDHLQLSYLFYDPLADGLMIVLGHCDGGCHEKDLDQVSHRLSSCFDALTAISSAGETYSVYEQSTAAFILGYIYLFDLHSCGCHNKNKTAVAVDKAHQTTAFYYLQQSVKIGQGTALALVAECYLGLCYLYGAGVVVNVPMALKCIKKAADKGNILGQYWYGLCLLYGVSPEEIFHPTEIRKRQELRSGSLLESSHNTDDVDTAAVLMVGQSNLRLFWDNVQMSELQLIEVESSGNGTCCGNVVLAFPYYKPECSVGMNASSSSSSSSSEALGAGMAGTRQLYNSETSAEYLTTGIGYIKTAAALGFSCAQNKLGELYTTGVLLKSDEEDWNDDYSNGNSENICGNMRMHTGNCSPLKSLFGSAWNNNNCNSSSSTRSLPSPPSPTPRRLWTEYVHSANYCTSVATDTILNRDPQSAYSYFCLASQQGCLRALLNKANCCHLGLGTREDPTEASKCHTAAILQYQQATECA